MNDEKIQNPNDNNANAMVVSEFQQNYVSGAGVQYN